MVKMCFEDLESSLFETFAVIQIGFRCLHERELLQKYFSPL